MALYSSKRLGFFLMLLCVNETYGQDCPNCKNYCKSDEVCHRGGCLNHFTGPKCDQPPLYIFTNPPQVNCEYNKCHLTVVDFDGSGRNPNYYIIQYRKPYSSEWISSDHILFRRKHKVPFYSLTKGKNYTGRVFGITKTEDSNMPDFVHIPTFQFTTLCDDLSLDCIKLEVDSKSVKIMIEDPDDKLCSLDGKRLFIQSTAKDTKFYHDINSVRKHLELQFNYLEPNTWYNFGVSNTTDEIAFGSFSTTEEKPTAVTNVNFYMDDATRELKLTWNPPVYPNGVVKFYTITYEIFYEGCKTYGPANSFNTSDGETTSYTFNDVEYFIGYNVKIKPYNSAGYGPQADQYVRIEKSDEIAEDEVTIQNIIPGERDVTFELPNCKKRRGDIYALALYTGVDDWCPSSRGVPGEVSLDTTSLLKINGLEPYCRYNFTLRFYRDPQHSYSKWTRTLRIQTKESSPNQIKEFQCYEKSNDYIALRWLPPAPPTGQLTSYSLTIEEGKTWSRFSSFRKENISVQNCILFPGYDCVKISDLKKGSIYQVEIIAYNQGNPLPSFPVMLKSMAKIEEPGPPRNLTYSWSDDNFLMLTWHHPLHVNGTLTSFNITIIKSGSNDEYNDKYEISAPEYYKPFYSKTVKNLPLPGEFSITILSRNFKELDSKRNPTIFIRSPPPIPNDTVTIKRESNSLHFSYNETKYDQDLYRFIYILIGQCPSCQVDFLQFKDDLVAYHKTRDTYYHEALNINNNWILSRACEYKSNLNDCRSIKNDPSYPINDNEHYMVGFIWIYKYAGSVRSNYVIQSTEGPQPYTKSVNSLYGTVITGVLLILFLLLIIGTLFIVSKKYDVIIPSITGCACVKLEALTLPGCKSTNAMAEATYVNQEEIGLRKISRVRPVSRIIFKPLDLLTEDDVICPGVPLFRTKHSKRIKLDEFSDYLRDSVQSGELLAQHNTFPKGLQKPHTYGMLPENKAKNRYRNLMAYDDSRVVLEKVDGDEFSDYINADYVDGFRHPKAYIATQGPKPNTVVDFWRMVWQENVTHIVMMANIIEGNKKKTEQYWPDINEEEKYGDYTVSHISSEVFANYDFRTFELQFRHSKPRKIGHLHFKVWPDHGVPLYPQSLVPFLRKLLRLKNTDFPLVVHCSAGVGRTGTIILCDICLRMAAAEGYVDFFAMLEHLRNNRANLVDNIEQYMLAHLVVLNCLTGMNTQIPINDKFAQTVSEISNIPSQLDYIKSIEWQDDAMKATRLTSYDEHRNFVAEKNRFPDIVPDPLAQVLLRPYPPSAPNLDINSTYINAVQVDGFCQQKRFVVTQFPLPNTTADFWRLILERNYTVVVCLNDLANYKDPTCPQFWPDKRKSLQPLDGVTVKNIRSRQLSGFVEMIFDIISDNRHDQKLTVKMLKINSWAPKETVPPNISEFISFVEDVIGVARGCSQFLVTCYDGATASGLFLALTFLIEKIDLEHECDVCQAIRSIRTSRKQFVNCEDQIRFLYKAAVLYVETKFNQYSNLK